MSTYNTRQRALFAGLALLLILVAVVLIVQLSELREPEDALESFVAAVGCCGLAVLALKIVATGTTWPWFERAGGGSRIKRVAGWGLLILASFALLRYARRHH
jgi:MYXO-CTERM domain-containing protein